MKFYSANANSSDDRDDDLGCWDRFMKIFKDKRYTLSIPRSLSGRSSSVNNVAKSITIDSEGTRSYVPRIFDKVSGYENGGYESGNHSNIYSKSALYKGSMPDSRRVSLKPSISLISIEEEDDDGPTGISLVKDECEKLSEVILSVW